MKISSIILSLNENDLLSILKDIFKDVLALEELSINEVNIDKSITVSGQYKNKIKVNFKGNIEILKAEDNIIYLRVNKAYVGKMKIFKFLVNFALGKALENSKKMGISTEKDVITIDMLRLAKYIPYVDLEILSIFVDKEIKVEIKDLNLNLKDDKKEQEEEILEVTPKVIHKRIDGYTKWRKEALEKVPEKYKPILKYAIIIPDISALVYKIFKDERVDLKVKILSGMMLSYMVSPIDIFPDFIPFIGKIDDVAIALFGLNTIINKVPEEVVLENWQGEDDIIEIVQQGTAYLTSILGGEKINKMLNLIKGSYKSND